MTTFPIEEPPRAEDTGDGFHSPAPVVRLVNAFEAPFLNAMAAAKTCYAQKGIVLAEELAADEAEGDAADSETLPHAPLAQSIYEAGHHTVFQHAYFQFVIDNVSRHFIWSFLHSHPFYNSEQVSQRYVKVKPGTYAVPPMPPRARRVYERAVEAQTTAYEALCARLVPLVEAEYFRVFPGRKKVPAKYRGAIRKKAYEVARYVLPIATFSRLHHTVSALTVFRYYRACGGADAPAEQRSVATRMIQEILRIDPRYRTVIEGPLEPERFPEAARGTDGSGHGRTGAFRASFDGRLGDRMSRLVDYKPNAEEVLADSVREVLGETAETLSDDEAVRLALDPARNPLFGEALNLSTHSKLGRCLSHASYTFRKKLSHTADSQNQRHRMTPASRPILAEHVDDVPDFITPRLIASDATVRAEFIRSMERAWEAVAEVRRCGAEKAHAVYLLPNAVAVRFTESGDLLNLHHKFAMRLCYNAQEEIWQASLDEVEEIRRVHPRIGSYLLPPCGLRRLAGASPICPEGSRYCGVKVWRLDLSEYERLL